MSMARASDWFLAWKEEASVNGCSTFIPLNGRGTLLWVYEVSRRKHEVSSDGAEKRLFTAFGERNAPSPLTIRVMIIIDIL